MQLLEEEKIRWKEALELILVGPKNNIKAIYNIKTIKRSRTQRLSGGERAESRCEMDKYGNQRKMFHINIK